MKLWIGKLAALSLVCLIFLGIGYLLGEVRVNSSSAHRFEKISDTKALDTKIGKICSTENSERTRAVPSGITLDPPQEQPMPFCWELSAP